MFFKKTFFKLIQIGIFILVTNLFAVEELSTDVTKNSVQSLRSAKNVAPEELISFKPLSENVRPQTTFSRYTASKNISMDVAIWKNRIAAKQTPYKVSLVGININTWLENPQYFNTLQKIGDSFPITSLLDNLQSYNPDLQFNDPALVKKILETDIYTPYLQNITSQSLPRLQFADIKSVISYTRNYHIYGVGAQEYPYFGRPSEGSQRKINLGILRDQLNEITAKMPDTDIFLVAMINIIPNWLEETFDVFQINQQEVEILIYAFDRNRKLIGGSGIPLSFWFKGQKFVFEQKIKSKIWQPSVSREFYITPSYKIINTPMVGSLSEPNITIPNDKIPMLNKRQKFILKAIKYLDQKKKSINVELFEKDGKHLFKPYSVKYQKVKLEKRILNHYNSSLLVENNDDFEDGFLLARLKGMSKSIPISARSLLLKKRPPSNEGDKMLVLFSQLKEAIDEQPMLCTNENTFTNVLLPFETETDPALYRKKRRDYYSLPHVIKAERKKFNIETKQIIKTNQLFFKNMMFWRTKAFQTQPNPSDVLKDFFVEWKKSAFAKNATKKKLIRLYRDQVFFDTIVSNYPGYVDRSSSDMRTKLMDKSHLVVKMEKFSNKSIILSNNLHNKGQNIEEEYNEFKLMYNNLINQELINYQKLKKQLILENKTPINIVTSRIQDVSKIYDLDLGIASLISTNTALSPVELYNKRMSQQEDQKKWFRERILYYEGFSFGLSSEWAIKFGLEDRIDYL
ncbi:MAG: hypothetical protein ACRCVW_06500 [Brevinema sp.]